MPWWLSDTRARNFVSVIEFQWLPVDSCLSESQQMKGLICLSLCLPPCDQWDVCACVPCCDKWWLHTLWIVTLHEGCPPDKHFPVQSLWMCGLCVSVWGGLSWFKARQSINEDKPTSVLGARIWGCSVLWDSAHRDRSCVPVCRGTAGSRLATPLSRAEESEKSLPLPSIPTSASRNSLPFVRCFGGRRGGLSGLPEESGPLSAAQQGPPPPQTLSAQLFSVLL